MLVNGAKERNLKLAFTFVVDSRDKHYNFTPDYVREAGCKGYVTTTGSVQVWSPYPDDPIFQEKYAKFLQDLPQNIMTQTSPIMSVALVWVNGVRLIL